MKKLVLILSACSLLAACNSYDKKYSELKEQSLNCKDIIAKHKSNEEFIDVNRPIAQSEGPGLRALSGFGGILAPVALVASIKQVELYKYRDNLRENEALRRLAAENKCPLITSKYPIGAE